MTATVADLDQATRDELMPPCEEHVGRPQRKPCLEPAAWIVTFALTDERSKLIPPQQLLLCDTHTQEWAQHMADCPGCQRLASLTVEPLDRKATRP